MSPDAVLQCAVAGPHDDLDISQAFADAAVAVSDVALESDPVATIRRANFVVAFLSEGASSTLVDVGIAIALRKPVLLVAESSRNIPDRLLGYPRLVTNGLSYEDLALQLRSFAMAFVPKSTTARDEPVMRLRVGTDDSVSVARLPNVEGAPKAASRQLSRVEFHSDTEFQVAATLSRAGATVVAQMREAQALTIPDLAASFPDLGPSFSTILVEIGARKTPLLSKKGALRSAMEERGLQLGMLVTLEELDDTNPDPGILVISLPRLGELVESNQLLATLRQARNRVVHRVS